MYVWLDMQIVDSSAGIKFLEYAVKDKACHSITMNCNNVIEIQDDKYLTLIFEVLYNTIFYKQILFWKSH